jgi:hypothetical protein
MHTQQDFGLRYMSNPWWLKEVSQFTEFLAQARLELENFQFGSANNHAVCDLGFVLIPCN